MERLLIRIKNGENGAFSELFYKMKDQAFQTCLAICGNCQDAEEAVQKGFIRVHKKIHQLKSASQFQAWFYTIMVNTAKSQYSQIKRYLFNKSEDYNEVYTQEEPLDNFNVLIQSLQHLPRGYKTVFVLHYLQDIPHTEIAAILGISPETCRSQYHRARSTLKIILTQKFGVNFEN